MLKISVKSLSGLELIKGNLLIFLSKIFGKRIEGLDVKLTEDNHIKCSGYKFMGITYITKIESLGSEFNE